MARKTSVKSRPGVYYTEHATRLHRGRPDRYFTIRYRWQGRLHEEALGWASRGITADDAWRELCVLKSNQRSGTPPFTLSERRAAHAAHLDEDTEEHARRIAADLTVRDLAARFFAASHATMSQRHLLDSQTRITRHLLPLLGDLRCRDLTPDDIRQARAALESGPGRPLAPASVRHTLQALRRAINWASEIPVSRGHQVMLFAGRNPVRNRDLPALDNARVGIFWPDELDRIQEAARAHSILHDAILLTRATGCRLEEVASLPCAAVDVRVRKIEILDAKTGSRTVYLDRVAAHGDPDAALTALRARCEAGHPHVFPSEDARRLGDHVRPDNLGRRFSELVDALGLNAGATDRRLRRTFHTLRHTWITCKITGELAMDEHNRPVVVGQGMNPMAVMRLSGHRTWKMMERYVHLADDLLKQLQLGHPS